MFTNIYTDSCIAKKLEKNNKLAFLDLDFTLTGEPQTQQKVRDTLEQKGYAITFITSRPYELVLSDASLNISPNLNRPVSQSEINEAGEMYHKDLAEIDRFNGLIDPDVIASTTGMEIYVRQLNGQYVKDPEYHSIDISSAAWRKKVMDTIHDYECIFRFKRYEDITNYNSRKVDIAPPEYRIQIQFDSLKEKNTFIHHMSIKKHLHFYAVDDSEPEIDKYSLYLFPVKAEDLKGQAVDHILQRLQTSTKIQMETVSIFLSGDSYPDLAMGLYSCKDTDAVFFLPGGSRMTSSFIDPQKIDYLDIDISSWKKNIKRIKRGIYSYFNRTIYIGDELFPGQRSAESMLSFVQSPYFEKL